MAKTKKIKSPYQKQRANVYTMMLVMSFLFLTLGTVLMYLELNKFRPGGPDSELDIEAKKSKDQHGTVSFVIPAGVRIPSADRLDVSAGRTPDGLLGSVGASTHPTVSTSTHKASKDAQSTAGTVWP